MLIRVLYRVLVVAPEHVRVVRAVREHVLGVARVVRVARVVVRRVVIRVVGQTVRTIAPFLVQEIALADVIAHVKAQVLGLVNL